MAEINDPRILFAAERTVLAWSRTSLTLMGFGFLIERFGLFLHAQHASPIFQRDLSFWVGIVFIFLGTIVAAIASLQHRRFINTLGASEIPEGYWVNLGVITNLGLGVLGLGLMAFLVYGFQ
jgi:putative membrane protein